MFDTHGYHPNSLLNISNYVSVVWTIKKRSIPSFTIVYAAPTFYETIIHPKVEVVELTIMTTYNKGAGHEAQE